MQTLILLAILASDGLPPRAPVPPQAPSLEVRVENLELRMAALEKAVLPKASWDPVVPVATVVPAGHHAHVTDDGRTIVHSNAFQGNHAAHAGVAWSYRKSATAGQVVQSGGFAESAPVWSTSMYSEPPASFQRRGFFGRRRGGNCPGGICPID